MSKKMTRLAFFLSSLFIFTACNEVGLYDNVPFCGNAVLDTDELCEGNQFKLGYDSCEAFDDSIQWSSGKPGCTSHCKLDQGSCQKAVSPCGNGQIDAGEDCDGMVFAEDKNQCSALDPHKNWLSDGAPSCSLCTLAKGTCLEDTSNEEHCGNQQIDENEPCDGELFANDDRSCKTLDPTRVWKEGGLVSCEKCALVNGSCEEDFQVMTCGNQFLERGEACDGELFANDDRSCTVLDATKHWVQGGEVACNNCEITVGSCEELQVSETCNNGILDSEEVCDSESLIRGPLSCISLSSLVGSSYSDLTAFWVGKLACSANCAEILPGTCQKSDLSTEIVAKYLHTSPDDPSSFSIEGVKTSGLSNISWNAATLSWQFANWQKSEKTDLPNPNIYIDFLVGDVSAYQYISISFTYRRYTSTGSNKMAVTVYDGDNFVNLAQNLENFGFSGWFTTGNIVVPTEGINDLHFRINSYVSGSFFSLKNLVVTGLK